MTEADIIQKQMRSKSMDWFLYDIGLRHERVKLKALKTRLLQNLKKISMKNSQNRYNLKRKKNFLWILMLQM